MSVLRSAGPARRAVLGGAALAVVTGCTSVRPAAAPPPGPQVRLLEGAIRGEAALIALYDAVLTAHPDLHARLDPMRDHHARHLMVLRRHYVPGTDTATPTPTPTPAPTASAVPAGRAHALRALRTAERRAAAARADEVRRAAPGLAQLLASIGACEAGHAQVLA